MTISMHVRPYFFSFCPFCCCCCWRLWYGTMQQCFCAQAQMYDFFFLKNSPWIPKEKKKNNALAHFSLWPVPTTVEYIVELSELTWVEKITLISQSSDLKKIVRFHSKFVENSVDAGWPESSSSLNMHICTISQNNLIYACGTDLRCILVSLTTLGLEYLVHVFIFIFSSLFFLSSPNLPRHAHEPIFKNYPELP